MEWPCAKCRKNKGNNTESIEINKECSQFAYCKKLDRFLRKVIRDTQKEQELFKVN